MKYLKLLINLIKFPYWYSYYYFKNKPYFYTLTFKEHFYMEVIPYEFKKFTKGEKEYRDALIGSFKEYEYLKNRTYYQKLINKARGKSFKQDE